MTKKNRELKIKLLCDIEKFIAEEHHFKEVEDKAVYLCLFYFPQADLVFLNYIQSLALVMQDLYFTSKHLDGNINALSKVPIEKQFLGNSTVDEGLLKFKNYKPQYKYQYKIEKIIS